MCPKVMKDFLCNHTYITILHRGGCVCVRESQLLTQTARHVDQPHTIPPATTGAPQAVSHRRTRPGGCPQYGHPGWCPRLGGARTEEPGIIYRFVVLHSRVFDPERIGEVSWCYPLVAPQEPSNGFVSQVFLTEEGIFCVQLPLGLCKMLLARQLGARPLIIEDKQTFCLGGFSNLGHRYRGLVTPKEISMTWYTMRWTIMYLYAEPFLFPCRLHRDGWVGGPQRSQASRGFGYTGALSPSLSLFHGEEPVSVEQVALKV